MTIDIHSKEGQIIRQLIPLSTMPISQFTTLCQNISLEDASENSFLFKKNDTENDLIYLIDGSITLQSKELKVEIIKSGTESSRFALAHQIPRKIDAYSNTAVRFLRLNPDIINALPSISYEESASYMVIDEPDDDENNDDDWMTTLLKSPIFRALPPANLQQIIISLNEVAFKKGDSIIKQGDPGDYYYLIKNGHCLISRKPSANAKDIKLAQLRTQDTFGEDSLLSGEPRNVSITALTDITLLRLSKDKFISLIKDPSLKYISHAQIEDKLSNGAILIDVRSPDEYNKHHLPDSINTPFFSLRMQLKTLNKKKPVIVVCANGKTSEAAAFLLLRHKFKALIIEGGMEQEQLSTSEAPAAFAIDDGFETLSTDTADFEHNTQDSAEASADKNDQQNSLQLENQQLKQKIQNLTAEKIELETKYRVLFKQTEKMKAILDGLKNGGGGDS
ncbi:MAG: cyclic nucleotide-binding domain-containing protein [Methylococcaceae bacterium]|nr:cyclic nucleotide-binding domain-containing protein [Methylococcaceae bacterium]